jgi:flavodoxin
MKTLVVYNSRTGNTKYVAEEITAELGADIEEVVDLKKREGKMGYLSANIDAIGNRQTNIAETKRNPADYDLIVIGTPVWFWSPSSAIRTYVAKHDLSGMNVALFFTFDGGPRGVVGKTKNLVPNATFMGELLLAKPTENKDETLKKIVEWCTTLKQ